MGDDAYSRADAAAAPALGQMWVESKEFRRPRPAAIAVTGRRLACREGDADDGLQETMADAGVVGVLNSSSSLIGAGEAVLFAGLL